MRLSFQRLAMVWMIAACSAAFAAEPRHVALFQEEGRFGGWPANGGMWAWGNEILVCYTEADHEDRPGHSYDRATARNMLARSLDGGETWAREDAFAQGITGHAHDHRVGDLGKPPAALDTPIDFTHPGFAFLMQRENNHDGPSHFYYTYDRGKSWSGPFAFPNLDTHGFAARTDYVVDGRRKMVVFLTAAKRDGREGRIAAVRTDDGGMTWQRVAWIGPEPAAGRDFAIMPASVRLSPQKLLTVARHREGGETWLTSYLSEDNARTWQRLADPATGNMNTPPALLRLPDGRLVLAYVFRRSSGEGSSVCVRISSDDGQSWGDQIVLRGSEGANSDVGYPRIVRRPDGKLLIAYYWNHALRNDLPRYRYIAATIWSPGEQKKSGWADDRDNDKVIIGRPAITATRAKDGTMLWRREAGMILDRSLCAAGGRVFFHTRQALIAVDLKTGDELWRHETNLRPAALMAHEDAVLAVQSSLTRAFSAETGEELWQERGAGIRGRNPDIFLVGDHVCWSRGRFEVRHIITGELVKQLDSQNVLSSGHHRRCFVDRATANYLITGQRGSEFLDLHENNHKRHNWLRGPCLTGMMPANGLFYVPPHQCFCYPSVRMDGFFALASNISKGDSDIEASEPGNADRLRQGPAYAQALEMAAPSADPWHTYRQNAERSGATRAQVPASLDRLWSTAAGGNLTQPIVAGRKVFVACKDAGTLHCLDFDSGTLLWSRTAAGRIDSPPSYHEGFVIFGSRDGRVYSLRATDGELAWSFRAAPADRQIVSYERLESAWPAHGSVLILDGLVYSSAGRSGFIDGGIDLYALDSVTGRVVHQTKLQGPQPDISQPSYAFHKEGYRADLLTTDGRYLYLGRTALDRNLDIVPTERVHLIGNQRGDELEYQKMPGMRLVATGGFLDETFWNRTWWMYSYVWPGFHFAVQAPKSGQMLVFDDQQTYAVKHYTTRNLHSPMQFPGSGYLLMADDNDNEPLFYRGEGEPKPIEWEIEYPASQRPELNLFGDAAHDKGPGFSRARPARWTSWVDVRVEAMVLANDTLFVAGTPDIVPSDDPLAALEGRMGGVLKIFCAEDGEELAKYPLKSPPVFDGLIAAKGRLLLSTKDGAVICMGQK